MRFIRFRLFPKMLLIYSLLTLVPLIVVGVTFYVQTSHLMERDLTEAEQQDLSHTATRIDASLYDVKQKVLELGKRQPLRSYLQHSSNDWQEVTATERRTLEAIVSELLVNELEEARSKIGAFVDNIYLLDLRKEVYSANHSLGIEFVNAVTVYPFEFDRMSEWAFFTDYGRMICMLELYAEGANADQQIGFIIMSLDRERVTELYKQYPSDTFYITSSDNLIVSADRPELIGRVLDVRGPADLLLLRQKSQYSNFQYVRLAKPGSGNLVERQAIFSLGVTLVSWVVVFLVTYLILKRITNPIQLLTRLMRKAEREDYQLMPDLGRADEIAMLCDGYNKLVQRTEELIRLNYKSELSAREAELKAIRMYINPHFLYNIMEHISIMSQSPDKVAYIPDIMKKLSSIFRFSILPGDSFVSLETELSYIEKLLQIHKYRFGDRLAFSIQLPPMLRQVAVPRLILQPLVENAIIHGIDRLPNGGTIRIEAMEVDYQLLIVIGNDTAMDDGQERKHRWGLGSGLDNVKARIQHHYGAGYDVSLMTKDGWTTATLCLPIQIWEGVNSNKDMDDSK